MVSMTPAQSDSFIPWPPKPGTPLGYWNFEFGEWGHVRLTRHKTLPCLKCVWSGIID